MARRKQPTDFPVTVEGIGTFTFGRRTMADEFAIQRKFADICGGGEHTEWLNNVGGWVSTLGILTVTAPDGWDIDDMDPLDDAVYADLLRVYLALREQEDSFRGKSGKGSQAGGAGAGDHN